MAGSFGVVVTEFNAFFQSESECNFQNRITKVNSISDRWIDEAVGRKKVFKSHP